MSISSKDLGSGLCCISISGRLDILGTEQIAPQFEEMTTSAASHVIVDLAGISFLASIGIRALISNAKGLKKNGRRMALVVGDNAAVSKTLDAAGVDVLIPMFADLPTAEAALQG